MSKQSIRPGQIITGALFNERMRVETIRPNGPDTWTVGLVGTQSERFRSVNLTSRDIESLTIFDITSTYDGDAQLLRIGLQAYSLGIAYEFDPYFGLSISRVDPLPHQLEAVYEYLLKLARVRFLLADDAGAGKTIMAGDLTIVDEAHRMSASDPEHKTLRYRLGELLREASDHLLLLTATPHKGDPINFSFFLQLLDQDAYADVRSIREAMDRRRAPFYLRRTKEAMVYFPERQSDGTWTAKKIFAKRIPHTVDFLIDGAEFELYRGVTRFVKQQSARAAAQGDDPRARAVGFLTSLYQRRLASSTFAMRHFLENRAKRLEDGLKRAQELISLSPPDIPDPEEMEQMEDYEREQLEKMLDAITLASNANQIQEEIDDLKRLAEKAQAVEDSGAEAKLSRLKDLLLQEGFFDHPEKRLLLTENERNENPWAVFL